MSEYSTRAFLKDNALSPTVGNSETETEISKTELISCGDSNDLYVIAECSSVSGTGAVIKMQECHRKDGTFTDVAGATVTITGNGTFEFQYQSATIPLKPFIKIVCTTGGSDAVTVDRLYRTRRL